MNLKGEIGVLQLQAKGTVMASRPPGGGGGAGAAFPSQLSEGNNSHGNLMSGVQLPEP